MMLQALLLPQVACFTLLAVLLPVTQGTLTAVYLPTSCGTTVTLDEATLPSVQLESATGLTYAFSMDCTITFTAPSGYLVLASIQRFELEPKRSGTCPDYVNIHDGTSVSATALNFEALCGSSLTNNTYVTSGTSLTLKFVTDTSAVYLGFNIIFTMATTGVCASGQHVCNNTYCTPAALMCDTYDQCGDLSDEDGCETIAATSSYNWTPLIVGLTLGLLVIVLIVTGILVRRHRRNRWRRFMNENIDREDVPDPDHAYPVTHKYFRGVRGQHPDIASYRATDDARQEKPWEAEKPVKS